MIEPYNLETNSSINLMFGNIYNGKHFFFSDYFFNGFDFYKFNYLANSEAI